ncbi:hypothetical protein KC678_01270, partial [Candidatus Dojkabacteria bacterium]|nr:hypothetical protein [Candidatus Dojkabacteria bacterium]
RELTYPSVGFSRIGIGADYGSLRKGKDIYAQEVFSAQIDFGEEELSAQEKDAYLSKVLDTIETRVEAAKINDITFEGIETNGTYSIALYIPSYYEDKEEYAKALLRQGKLSLEYVSGDTDIPFDLNIENVKSVSIAQNIKYSQTVSNPDGSSQTRDNSIAGLNIKMYFDKDARTEVLRLPGFVNYFQGVLNGESYGAHMLVDGAYTHDIVSDDSDFTLIRALPRDVASEKARQDIAEVILTYFEQDQPLQYQINLANESSALAPNYNPEGTTFIAVSFIIGIALLVLALIKQIGLWKAIAFTEMLAFGILLTTVIIKFVQAPISSGFIIGAILIITLYTVVILWLLDQEDKRDLNSTASVCLMLTVTTVLSFLGLYVTGNIIGVFGQTIEIVTAGLIALLISIYINYKFIMNTFVLNKFSIREFLGIRKSYE